MAVGSLKSSSGAIQDAQTQQALSKIHIETLGMFEGIRRLSHDLHPATLRLVGLAAALRAHCVEVEKRHDVQVHFTTDGDFADLHPDVAVCLFRIAQESLRNGVVHGDARRLAVSLARSGDHVELTVTDDGRGFDLEAVRRDGSGLGLVSIEERAHVIGGDVQIVTGLRTGNHDSRASAGWFSRERSMSRARVLIADDHAFVLEGLVNLLKDKFEVVAAVTDGQSPRRRRDPIASRCHRHGHFNARVERDRGV